MIYHRCPNLPDNAGAPALIFNMEAGCKEYRKVDSVLCSVEAEERYEFTGTHLLKKNVIQDMYHNNSNNLEATFVKLSEKNSIFSYGI